jgi:hypothetical protein
MLYFILNEKSADVQRRFSGTLTGISFGIHYVIPVVTALGVSYETLAVS